MTIHITPERAIELLTQVAAEHPDFVYREVFSTCHYGLLPRVEDHAGHPIEDCPDGCIVGQVLAKVGLDLAQRAELPRAGVRNIAGVGDDSRNNRLAPYGITIDEDAGALLEIAQGWQDNYLVPWKDIVPLVIARIDRRDSGAVEVIGYEPKGC